MYNDNPTIADLAKTVDESKQGEVFFDGADIPGQKSFYIESYGCQMNFSDSEIVASILAESGYGPTRNMEAADLLLINTCSIREKAEYNVRRRLGVFNRVKRERPEVMIGILGCMAERLKSKLLEEEKLVDLVVGPDAYRDIPNLISSAEDGDQSINVLLSREETYSEITPMRLGTNGVSAFISIMRGCDNMCSFCVVPFTRGRERSRNAFSIIAEATDLVKNGYKEVTLLGQNVDSYKWENPETNEKVTFAQLLEMVALVDPSMRIRFSTSHPKDITDEVLHTIAKYENICNYIHLPVQSGNSRILKKMNRTYTKEWYKERVDSIYRIIPDCAISADIITGFCSETEEDHQETLSIMEYTNYTMSYMFFYSERPGTLAAKKYEDDIPLKIKKRRLAEVIELQNKLSVESNKLDIGKVFKVLIEGNSKKSDLHWKGKNDQFKMLIFPKTGDHKAGDYVMVRVDEVNQATLKGEIIEN